MQCNAFGEGGRGVSYENVTGLMFYMQILFFFFRMGGIIPPVARDLHMQNIKDVVDTAMARAGMTLKVLK
jgi:tRNA A37 threonylcarbamoyltransferase TsaD